MFTGPRQFRDGVRERKLARKFYVTHVVKTGSLCKPIYIYSEKGLLMLASTCLLLVVVLVVLVLW